MPELSDATLLAFVLARMSGCIYFNPILGRRNFPAMYKTGIAILLTIIIFTYTEVTIPEIVSPLHYLVLLFREMMVGYIIGFIVTLFLYIVLLGGEIIDYKMGLSMSNVFDPQTNTQISLNSTIFNIVYIFIFLAAYGHITLIGIFLTSGNVFPYGQVAISSDAAMEIANLFSQCTVLAVKFAMPIVVIEVLLEIGVGILMRAIPSINVFVLNIQAKMLLGMLMIVLLFPAFSNFLSDTVEMMFESIERITGLYF